VEAAAETLEEPAEPEFEEGDVVFYPQIGHCDVGRVIDDRLTGLLFLELFPHDISPSTRGHRILVPMDHLEARGIRISGDSPGVMAEILGSDFEPRIEDAAERLDLITAQERDGSVASLALALKRLHLRRETKTITREEEKRRARIRKWLVAEHTYETGGTTGQAQSAITRLLGRTMAAVRRRQKRAEAAQREKEREERKRRAREKRAQRV